MVLVFSSPYKSGYSLIRGELLRGICQVHVPLQIGVVFNFSASGAGLLRAHVPLQIGVVFNYMKRNGKKWQVLVPLQIGVVFNLLAVAVTIIIVLVPL